MEDIMDIIDDIWADDLMDEADIYESKQNRSIDK